MKNNNEPYTGRAAGWIVISCLVMVFIVTVSVFLSLDRWGIVDTLVVILSIIAVVALILGLIERAANKK